MAIEAMKQLNIPIACTMKIGPAGDLSLPHKSPQECAVRMAKAGMNITRYVFSETLIIFTD